MRAAGSPALQEAAAALQDLSCQAVADDVERLEARRSELTALMSGLPVGIQSAPNGPYLLTNITRMTDWLGVSLDPTPQAALCRCGASAIKPWCDGSHIQIGWEDGKSEDRVPDRLDRYTGLGVTIADNRGICAHSGFCTDRLPAVFRTDEDPFVAPAGGRVDEILRAARACPSGALSATTDDGDPVGRSDTLREPAIEVSKDGPYRVTGAVDLHDRDGQPEARTDGASLEHYSLCRCGHRRTSRSAAACTGTRTSTTRRLPSRRHCSNGPADFRPCCGSPSASTKLTSRKMSCWPRCSRRCPLITRNASPPGWGRCSAGRRPTAALRRVRPDDQPAPRQGAEPRTARALGAAAGAQCRRGGTSRRC